MKLSIPKSEDTLQYASLPLNARRTHNGAVVLWLHPDETLQCILAKGC